MESLRDDARTTPAVLVLTGILSLRGIQTLAIAYSSMLSSVRITSWSDADKALGEEILRQGVRRVITTDWGIAAVLSTRTSDRVAVADVFFSLAAGDFDQAQFTACAAPDCIVVSRVEQRAIDPKTNARLERWLHAFGLRKVDVSVVRDRHDIPTFELWRTRPSTTTGQPAGMNRDPRAAY